VTRIGQITLLVTFGTRENFLIEHLHFDVADFEMAYIAFLKWLALTKFMAIPQYAYLVLTMPRPHGLISIMGDVKRAYDCDMKSYEIADRLTTSIQPKELKKALAEPPPPSTRSFLRPINQRCPSSQMTHLAKQSSYPRRSPLRLTWEIVYTQNSNSHSSNSSRKIETSLHGRLLTYLEFLRN
jgi:hypothetical protein